jgi:pimeloyl-ACP methyl ester carboxylesterase
MAPLFEHYRRQRTVYAPELPGFGRSTRTDVAYSPELYADALARFLREVVGQPADVIALSLGAEFAARAVAAVPDHVTTLGLISPTGFGKRQPPQGPATDRILKVLRLPLLGPKLFRVLTTRPSIRYFLRQSFAGPVPPELVDYAGLTARQPGAHFAPFRFLSMKLFTPNAFERLYQPLELPVLVLHDKDPNITFERLDDIADRPNWHIHRVAPSRGLPHWEKPEATTAALDDFWAAYT